MDSLWFRNCCFMTSVHPASVYQPCRGLVLDRDNSETLKDRKKSIDMCQMMLGVCHCYRRSRYLG